MTEGILLKPVRGGGGARHEVQGQLSWYLFGQIM